MKVLPAESNQEKVVGAQGLIPKKLREQAGKTEDKKKMADDNLNGKMVKIVARSQSCC